MQFVKDLLPFSESKLRPNLKMAAQRIQLVNNKKENAIKHQKREIATLLTAGKEEKARIKAEHLIRDDFTIEAYEIIALLCELVHERLKHLLSQDECPTDLIGTVATLLYAAPRCDISEMVVVEKQFVKRFGKKFAEEVVIPENNYVNPRIVEKLAVRPPSAEAVIQYLTRIAEEFNVDWAPTDLGVPNRSEAIPTPTGFSVPMAPGSQYGEIYHQGGQAHLQPPPSFAQSFEHPPASGDPNQYAASGAKIKDSTITEVDRDDDYNNNNSGGGGIMAPPPPYTPYADQGQRKGSPPGAGGGELVLPEPPIAKAEVCLPAAPGDASNVPPVVAAPASGPDYDDLAARFAALSK